MIDLNINCSDRYYNYNDYSNKILCIIVIEITVMNER